MRKGLVGSIVVLLAAVALCVTSGRAAPQSGTSNSKSAVFDPHDLSGVWLIKQTYLDPAHLGVYGTPMRGVPPMTPWAKEKYAVAHPGGVVGTGDEDNDPALHCDPTGMPRIMGEGPFEFIQIPGRILVLIEDAYARRTIWMDGRPLPKDPDPTWYGYSVGRWEGDTLVIDTIGLDDRSWLNGAGYPHSDAAHIVERIHRPSHDTLEISTTITDSKAYTQPWVSNAPRVYLLKPKYEMQEALCVPEDEQSFLKSVREPAAPKAGK
jgi:hypothetical protein